MKKNRFWRYANLLAAIVVSAGVLVVVSRGIGPLPPLGNAFNPGTGVWTDAADASIASTETLQIHGLNRPVTINFDSNGVPHIDAQTDHDLFLATGYLHAKFRLFQMDLMRRQGEGLLSQVVGAKALPSDKFELQLGLLRTAQEEWNHMAAANPAKKALIAYSQGVNDVISSDEQSGTLPMLFKLMGYEPTKWTPVDSLVIQGDMTQTLDFSTGPLEYALLEKSLGPKLTMDWFPVLPPDTQHPYDTGPHVKDPLASIEQQPVAAAATPSAAAATPSTATVSPSTATVSPSAATATPGAVDADTLTAVTSLLTEIDELPASAVHTVSNSNNWAVDGTKTASGTAMLAGDPHLSQTLPAIWYQLAGKSPSYQFTGVSIPGVPTILIGRNQQIAWSLTNVQNQATLYYKEKTDKEHPNQYYWNGQWRNMQHLRYTIPVKGGNSVNLDVALTVHGPVMTQAGQTLSVDWVGALPSPDLDVMLNIIKADNFEQFKQALQQWHAPSQNFVYADDNGNIGMISAGYYPIVKSGEPWLPLPGTGQSDVLGTIPYKDVPQTYNPPSHFVFSANQREVSNDYPYYIGTTMDFFDNGYRADEIFQTLKQGKNLTVQDFEKLQSNTTDYLAGEIVPELLKTLDSGTLTPQEHQAKELLAQWNGQMNVNSAAASIWWEFWSQYLQDTFGPWWTSKHVPVNVDKTLQLGPGQTALDEDLEQWTLHNPDNAAFSLPNGTKRTASDVMKQAFRETVNKLSKQLGTNPGTWAWRKLHSREFPSLTQVASLGYGPMAAGGDQWTVDAADGGMVSTAGPSWRMIVNFGTGAKGVYPGGQSENPVSPLYSNLVSAWWNGSYYPLQLQLPESASRSQWTLHP